MSVSLEQSVPDKAKDEEEPSTIFIIHIQQIFRVAKEKLIILLNQLSSKTLFTLRDQLFYMFVQHFDENTLIYPGFNLTEDDLKVHLKRHMKPLNACCDIHNVGL